MAARSPGALHPPGCFNAGSCSFERGLRVGAPCHPTQGGLRAFGNHQAVTVVIAPPASQINVAIYAVDDAHAEFFLVEPCRGFDVRRGDLEVGKMGEGSFHDEFLLSALVARTVICRSCINHEPHHVFGEGQLSDSNYPLNK